MYYFFIAMTVSNSMVSPEEYWQHNDLINAQIFRQGPALFDAVKQAVLDKATVPVGVYDAAAHRANQSTLLATIDNVCSHGQWRPEIDAAGFWELAWARIAYQGTRADKASKEIDLMPKQIPLFADFRAYDRDAYQFDKHEWMRFSQHWKRRFAWFKLVRRHRARLAAEIGTPDIDLLTSMALDASLKEMGAVLWGEGAEDWLALTRRWADSRAKFTDWLSFAKAQNELWEQSLALFAHPRSEALAIMTKSGPYEGISFSAHHEKMVKYLAVADFLKNFQGRHVLEYYTGADYAHIPEHQSGEPYRLERTRFQQVHGRFARHFGQITSLHLMMDLGFKTVKPDRVLTYLFSQLGWLITLPADASQKQVLEVYTDSAVVSEVLYRADVLAAAIAPHVCVPSVHRLLDIWFVKFGQEPEEQFGITIRLEGEDGAGLKEIYEAVKERLCDQNVPTEVEAASFARRWPAAEIWTARVRTVREGEPARRRQPASGTAPAPTKRISREAAEKIFVTTWRADLSAVPRRYPDRIDNGPKEAIIRLIERGADPATAFSAYMN